MQDLLGRTLVPHEDVPQLVRHRLRRGRIALGGREGDELPEGGVEVFLVVVVRTGLYFLPSPALLLRKTAVIPAHFSYN